MYIRSASTRHRSLTSIHRCLACSLRRSLLKTCSETSSVRVPRVVKGACGLMACIPKRVASTFRRAKDRSAALQRIYDLLSQVQLTAANEPSLCMWLPSFLLGSVGRYKQPPYSGVAAAYAHFAECQWGSPSQLRKVLYPFFILAKRAAIAEH